MRLRTLRLILWAPLILFLIFLGVVASGLIKPDDHVITSKMVGKPLPAFSLPPIVAGKPGLASSDFGHGQPRLLNIFASWCVPCVEETPQLLALKQAGVPIEAIALRDRPADAQAFLDRWGDPYQRIGSDDVSAVPLSIGSTGVPETYLIDGKGIIRLQHIGAIGPQDVPDLIDAVRKAE